MPRGDGTGPVGAGPMTGRAGIGSFATFRRAGRMGGPLVAGPGGTCVCPKCGHEVPHQRGLPCSAVECEKCGTLMVRKAQI